MARGQSKIKYVEINNKKYVKKIFYNTKSHFYQNELTSTKLFSKYEWFPNVLEINNNYIIYENVGISLRSFYKHNIVLTNEDIFKLKKNMVKILYDVYQNDIAHRDINGGNFIYNLKTKKLYLIDFEYMMPYKKKPPFLRSYDIIGSEFGLPNPKTEAGNTIRFFLKKMGFFPKQIIFNYDEIRRIYEKI